jgi:hypothetical protein
MAQDSRVAPAGESVPDTKLPRADAAAHAAAIIAILEREGGHRSDAKLHARAQSSRSDRVRSAETRRCP